MNEFPVGAFPHPKRVPRFDLPQGGKKEPVFPPAFSFQLFATLSLSKYRNNKSFISQVLQQDRISMVKIWISR